jgi:hypothetical protein
MADDAIIQADYTEWRMVKTRSTLQLIFEVPLEAQERVMQALGVPLPNVSTPVAIARLRANAEPAPQIEHANDQRAADDIPGKPPRPLSQVSAILCNIVAFRRFIMEQYDGWDQMPTVEEAADWLREQCGVQSRREFDTDDAAAANFRNIRAQYSAWMVAA